MLKRLVERCLENKDWVRREGGREEHHHDDDL